MCTKNDKRGREINQVSVDFVQELFIFQSELVILKGDVTGSPGWLSH